MASWTRTNDCIFWIFFSVWVFGVKFLHSGMGVSQWKQEDDVIGYLFRDICVKFILRTSDDKNLLTSDVAFHLLLHSLAQNWECEPDGDYVDYFPGVLSYTWWRHQMETFSASLAICARNSSVTGEFPAQRPVMRSFDVFFDLRLNKRLSKQWWGWWFETPSRPLWRHCNGKSLQLIWILGTRRVHPILII